MAGLSRAQLRTTTGMGIMFPGTYALFENMTVLGSVERAEIQAGAAW